jgi:hypothetical protein
MYSVLPNIPLIKGGKLSDRFFQIDCNSFHDACDYVWKLPYGRTSDQANWRLVLNEGTGTCSTKHALLKALSDELNLEIQLTLGIYPMHESNTPGVGRVLSVHSIDYIPEAHCYLRYKGMQVDLTRFDFEAEEPISEFFIERDIAPDHIGEFKQEFHKEFILNHCGNEKFQRLWEVRELCIQALST